MLRFTHMLVCYLLFTVLACRAVAQQPDLELRQEVRREGTVGLVANPAERAAPTPEERLALQILDDSADLVRGLEEPAMRAFTLLQVAQSYGTRHAEKAHAALLDAFTASLAIEDQRAGTSKTQLQGWILERLMRYDPAQAEELAAQAEPNARSQFRSRLLDRAAREKDFDRAQELLSQMQLEGDAASFPYHAVSQLLQHLPEERVAERQALFAQALAAFRREPQGQPFHVSTENMGALVVRFWRQLPPGLVLQAMDEMLARAREKENPHGLQLTLSSRHGAASFTSEYDYELFRLLPILRQLDRSRAERLERENLQAQSVLQKYPQGMASLVPEWGGAPDEEAQPAGLSRMYRSGRGGSSAQDLVQAEFRRRVADIARDAKENPKQALAAAMALPESAGQGAHPRADGLSAVARAAAESHPSVAREAMDSLMALTERLPLDAQSRFLLDVARLARRMGDEERARKAIREGFKVAERRYQSDTDSDDPNLGMRAYWPSTDTWRGFLRAAAELSPRLALELLEEIPEKDIELSLRVALANTWLKGEPLFSMVIDHRKSGRQLHNFTGPTPP